ncbi:MAG TPA: universal stress protein [Burkholderiaceae bacterium]|nr:universal stress protein [Burkholderiaceae bacterium]
MKILLPVDGSDYTIKAVNFLITHFEWFKDGPDLYLLNVQLPIPPGIAGHAGSLLGKVVIDSYYKEEAEKALAPATDLLHGYSIPFTSTYKVGDIAKEICAYVAENGIDMIVMGSHGQGALKNLLMGSVTTKVLATATEVPVLIVR